MAENTVTLYCTEGGSDKVYKAEVASSNGGYIVNFWYGSRTGTMRPGTKTKSPVSKEKAFDIWEKLVRSKKAKGYHEGVDAPAYTESYGTSKDSGIRPMLLTPDTEENLEKYIQDNAWGAQEKMNGIRLLLKIRGDSVVGINRKGLEISIPQKLRDGVAGKGPFLFDGELVGETYHAFDLLTAGPALAQDHQGCGYGPRHGLVGVGVEAVDIDCMTLVPLAEGEKAKRALVNCLMNRKKEGVVFKRLDGKYEPGKIANLKKAKQVKIKFYESGEFFVIRWNPHKQSIKIGAYDSNENLVNVGNVTVPDKHLEQVKDCEIVRVRYLYATDGDQLYQPNLDPDENGSVVRGDLDRKDCHLSQLKYEGKD